MMKKANEKNPGLHLRKICQSDAFVGDSVLWFALGQPLRSAKLGERIIDLGCWAGFERNAMPYPLQRGYANLLYNSISKIQWRSWRSALSQGKVT